MDLGKDRALEMERSGLGSNIRSGRRGVALYTPASDRIGWGRIVYLSKYVLSSNMAEHGSLHDVHYSKALRSDYIYCRDHSPNYLTLQIPHYLSQHERYDLQDTILLSNEVH